MRFDSPLNFRKPQLTAIALPFWAPVNRAVIKKEIGCNLNAGDERVISCAAFLRHWTRTGENRQLAGVKTLKASDWEGMSGFDFKSYGRTRCERPL